MKKKVCIVKCMCLSILILSILIGTMVMAETDSGWYTSLASNNNPNSELGEGWYVPYKDDYDPNSDVDQGWLPVLMRDTPELGDSSVHIYVLAGAAILVAFGAVFAHKKLKKKK